MSGTDLAYGAASTVRARRGVVRRADGISLRMCYAMSGTDIGYGATRCPRIACGPTDVLRTDWYRGTVLRGIP
eukprot:1621897-Rhodomonas_salina.4